MINEFGFKELYSVTLKATYPIEVGENTFEPGEIIASFDNIQIANFQEIKTSFSAQGGFDNRSHIFWESTKEIKINFTQGIFSKTQLALMTNAKLVSQLDNSGILIGMREERESDGKGVIDFSKTLCDPIFVYDITTGKKITDWSKVDNSLYLNEAYKSVIVDYQYNYVNNYTTMNIGKSLTSGFLSLTGKMRVKDDITGQVKTGIINIPKLKLMSDLSIRVGSDAVPQVGRLDAVAVPQGARGQSKVMEIIFLSDDIDADM